MSKITFTKGKHYAVQYGGWVVMQADKHYGEPDLLNADMVGEEQALANGRLYAHASEMYNMLVGLAADATSKGHNTTAHVINELLNRINNGQ